MRSPVLLALLAVPLTAGQWTDRFDLTLHRVLEGGPPRFDSDFVLADVVPQATRRFTEFSGDLSGRYIGALAIARRQTGQRYEVLDRMVTGALGLQKADGHFGDALSEGKVTDRDMALLWGNGRMLIGLLEYYGVSGSAEVLHAARKLGDFLVAVAPRFNAEDVRQQYNGEKFAVGYICWTNSLEGIVELYRLTADDRYLSLAREIAARTDRHASQHSHGFLTTLRGVVDLYRVTGEARYLQQAETEWKGVIDSGNLLVQGAVPEMFAPQLKRDEGCSEADWLRLSLDLWGITRKPEYLKQAELTLFNEFAFNQFHTGDFGHHTFSDRGVTVPFARAWWCCTFHGLRAMDAVFAAAFHTQAGTLYYDLPVDGTGGAANFSLHADSSLERNAMVQFTVVKADAQPHTLAIRIPEWASEVKLSLPAESRDGYVQASRTWKAGETVTATYTLRTRVVPHPKQQRVAIFRGPWLLAVDESASPAWFDEPSVRNKVELPEEFEPAAGDASGRFSVPAGRVKVSYLPGGYPMQPQKAVLRPIAEYTNGPDANELEFWFIK